MRASGRHKEDAKGGAMINSFLKFMKKIRPRTSAPIRVCRSKGKDHFEVVSRRAAELRLTLAKEKPQILRTPISLEISNTKTAMASPTTQADRTPLCMAQHLRRCPLKSEKLETKAALMKELDVNKVVKG